MKQLTTGTGHYYLRAHNSSIRSTLVSCVQTNATRHAVFKDLPGRLCVSKYINNSIIRTSTTKCVFLNLARAMNAMYGRRRNSKISSGNAHAQMSAEGSEGSKCTAHFETVADDFY